MSFTIACEFKSVSGITITARLLQILLRFCGTSTSDIWGQFVSLQHRTPNKRGQEYQSRAGNTPSREFRQTLKSDAILWDVVTVCNQLRGTPTLSYIEH